MLNYVASGIAIYLWLLHMVSSEAGFSPVVLPQVMRGYILLHFCRLSCPLRPHDVRVRSPFCDLFYIMASRQKRYSVKEVIEVIVSK